LNFLQLSDFQMIDEESPGRVEFLDGSQRIPGLQPFSSAYRPQDSLTTQVTEAMVRSVRNTTSPLTGEQLELAILTGDNADSQQFNETRWFIDILDGGKKVDPNSGIPIPGCEATPGSIYDGVRGGGRLGYYEPDTSEGSADGDGYSPRREENLSETGQDVTVRDFPGLFEKANEPFQTIGLDLPWYTAFGNHDALIQGNSPDAYFGPVGPTGEVARDDFQSIATGCEKVKLIPTATDADQVTTDIVPPDARRCYLAKDDVPVDPLGILLGTPCSKSSWIAEHFNTTGAPAGHGMAPAACDPTADAACAGYGRPPVADANNDGYYSFSPKPGLRFIALDSITDECGTIVCAEGSVDEPQFRWLRNQLELATAMGEYVITYSHHTLRTIRFPSTDSTEFPLHYGNRSTSRQQPANISLESLEDLFCSFPRFIAHVDGHEHENAIREHKCEGVPAPGYSNVNPFFEISTAAHLDWPQQARMIELVDNGDSKTMSLVLTILDHDGVPNAGGPQPSLKGNGQAPDQVLRLAAIGRELAYNDYQVSRSASGGLDDRNVIIVLDKPWTEGT
jgi:metallophosphoesterase (TIGR03767 family)